MAAKIGTIPALTPYQPGALTITGQELIEIASSSNATSAISASMLITDVVGKAPNAMTSATPSVSDQFAFYQASSGTPRSTTFNSLISFLRTVVPIAPIVTALRISSAATVNVTTADYFLALDPSSNPITVNLPGSPVTGISFLIKDATGFAASNSITIVPASGNIDGAATFVISSNFQSIAVTYGGTQWLIN